MTKDFLEEKKREQAAILKEYRTSLFDNAKDIGYSKKNDEWFDYFLKPQDSDKNLYKGIRKEAIEYFKKYGIAWWQCLNKQDEPTGHMVSSQINCLNHLFALRKDDVAIKAIIENATNLKIEKVLQSPIDTDGGYITFEFVCKNKTLLGEKHETRGANCTSVDALVYVQTTDNQNILIPIEWKYTETYYGKEANEESLDRYPKLIDSASNLKKWDDLYKADPYYELMRQTLLMEQIIKQKDINGIKAVDFYHIMVVPDAHTELKDAIEGKYIPTLKDKSKFHIIDPQILLSPLKGNDTYKDLITYLETRYWKAL